MIDGKSSTTKRNQRCGFRIVFFTPLFSVIMSEDATWNPEKTGENAKGLPEWRGSLIPDKEHPLYARVYERVWSWADNPGNAEWGILVLQYLQELLPLSNSATGNHDVFHLSQAEQQFVDGIVNDPSLTFYAQVVHLYNFYTLKKEGRGAPSGSGWNFFRRIMFPDQHERA